MATTFAVPRTSDGVLTIDELAVLLITSPAHIQPKDGQTVIVTTKDAYFWAVIFSELAGRDGEPEGFLRRVRGYLTENRDVFRLLYDTLGGDVQTAADSLFEYIARQYGFEGQMLRARASAAYLSLLQKGLIEDPFKKKVAAFLFCLAGLFPQNFSQTTTKGGETAIVYHSRAVNFDYQKGEGKQSHIEVDVKLVQIVREVYPKLIEIFDEVLGPGEEGQAPKTPNKPNTPNTPKTS